MLRVQIGSTRNRGQRSSSRSTTLENNSEDYIFSEEDEIPSFHLKFFLEMFFYNLLFPISIPIIYFVRGKIMLNNTILSPQNQWKYHLLISSLLYLTDIFQITGIIYIDSSSALTRVGSVHLAYFVYAVFKSFRFTYLTSREMKSLGTVVPANADEPLILSLPYFLEPTEHITKMQIELAERYFHVTTKIIKLRVNLETRNQIENWCAKSFDKETSNARYSTETIENSNENIDEKFNENSNENSNDLKKQYYEKNNNLYEEEVSGFNVLLGLVHYAYSKSNYNKKFSISMSCIIGISVPFIPIVYRAVEGENFTPFQNTYIGILGHVFLVTILSLVVGLSFFNLTLCANIFEIRALLRVGLFHMFHLKEKKPSFELTPKNLESFLIVVKVLRKVASHVTHEAEALLTAVFLAWLVVCSWFLYVFFEHGVLPSDAMVSIISFACVWIVIFIHIVLKGANANEQYSSMKLALLEIQLNNNCREMGVLISVLDDLEEIDSVKFFGINCSRGVIKSFGVLLISFMSFLTRLKSA